MAQSESTQQTVEIGVESLSVLVSEAKTTAEAIDDPEWETKHIDDAIIEGEEALYTHDEGADEPNPKHYQAIVCGRKYEFTAINENEAKMEAVERYKQERPNVGIPTEEIMTDVSLRRLIPTQSDGEGNAFMEDGVRVFVDDDNVANGDPYVAVVSETNDKGVPIDTQTITLGTGFESYDDIVHTVERAAKIGQPTTITVHFDRVDIYGLDAQANFEYTIDEDTDNV